MRENRNKDNRRQAERNDQHERYITKTKKETDHKKVYRHRISQKRLHNILDKQ